MGGNVVMLYAGIRPERIRRLINLEGFGMPATVPSRRQALSPVARRAEGTGAAQSPTTAWPTWRRGCARPTRCCRGQGGWLAPHWSRQDEGGQWQILGDRAHKRVNPQLYRVDEVLVCWRQIAAPLLWVQGDRTEMEKWWGHRYRAASSRRGWPRCPKVGAPRARAAGHMLHHDQPEGAGAAAGVFLG